MKRLRGALGRALPALALLASSAAAGLRVEAPGDDSGRRFRAGVADVLKTLRDSKSGALRRLEAAARSAPVDIVIRPITDDPATWHDSADSERGHTKPADGRPTKGGRAWPTGAIVYLPPGYVDRGDRRWKSAVLPHELVHAVDLAYGRYHKKSAVRERRAVFVQNLWRDQFGYALRTSYHGKFETRDYQDAKASGRVDEIAARLFAGGDFTEKITIP